VISGFVGEDADDLGAAFDFAVDPFQRMGAQLGTMLGQEARQGQSRYLKA
jgi:hypothetical protein